MVSHPRTPRESVGRSLALLWLFLAACASILAVGAIVIANRGDAALERQAVRDEVGSLSLLANTVLAPAVVHDGKLVASASLGRSIALPPEIRNVNVWRRDGTLLFSTATPEKVGMRVPSDDGLRDLFRDGEAYGSLIDLRKDLDERPSANARPGHDRLLDAYAPIVGRAGRTIGAYEIYKETTDLDAAVAASRHSSLITIAAVFLALMGTLVLLVTGASLRLRRQATALAARTAELEESYGLLEQGSLEAIESLNATVEAKDPYTAGHSQRVRTLALAIGGEVGMEPQRLEVLGMAALFHDIGKIAVPDAILTKPARLTPAEYEVIKDHSARGAEIVSRLSRLKDAVPAIRHHHERWDGSGYPDGLVGDAISLEASVIALADAWDAMTTARPYAASLPEAAALAQIAVGRGTQFSPRVVDAFVALTARAVGSLAA